RAPSATVIHLARALIGERSVEVRETGIRPGEKMHEIMVSEEEAHHCVRRGDYLAILPMLPELQDAQGARPAAALDKEFSSADVILDAVQTAALLRKHRLMPGDLPAGDAQELLR